MKTMDAQQLLNKTELALFVRPDICLELEYAGVRAKRTLFTWFIINDLAQIRTTIYDRDNYYQHGNKLTDYVNKPEVIEAFTTADMIAALPPFLMDYDALGNYTIMMAQEYELKHVVTGSRLADALAGTVLQMIKERKVTAHYITQKINSKR